MEKLIYEFKSYKEFLVQIAESRGARSGFKTAMAEATGCNLTYLSAVLNKDAQLNLEQAEKLVGFLSLNQDESHYFLLLVQFEKAGTSSLKSYFRRLLENEKRQRLNIKERLEIRGELREQDRNRYYSSWTYAAIHVALSIPSLRTPVSLSRYFRLRTDVVISVLEFFEKTGLAKRSGEQYVIGPTVIHLAQDAEQISMHHANWRTQALAHLSSGDARDLHYSAAVTLAKTDVDQVKDLLLAGLKKSIKAVEGSKEEEVFALNLDFFALGEEKRL